MQVSLRHELCVQTRYSESLHLVAIFDADKYLEERPNPMLNKLKMAHVHTVGILCVYNKI